MFIKLSFMFMIDKYVMFDWYTFVKPIMTFQLKSVMYGSLKECWNTAKNISDESVGLFRCHTFIFFCAHWFLTTIMQDEHQPTGLRPSGLYLSLGLIWGQCDKNVYCTSYYIYNSICGWNHSSSKFWYCARVYFYFT